MPILVATVFATSRLSPVIMTLRMPIRCSAAIAPRASGLTGSWNPSIAIILRSIAKKQRRRARGREPRGFRMRAAIERDATMRHQLLVSESDLFSFVVRYDAETRHLAHS